MNNIPICEYCNLTNIIVIHEYFYIIYIESLHISHYGFVCPVSFSNKKYIRVKKKKVLEKKENIYSSDINCIKDLTYKKG